MIFEPKKALEDLAKLRPGSSKHKVLSATDVRAARAYIAAYWTNLERFHPENVDSLFGLPHPYLVPAFEQGHEFDFNEMYYWDSYFMVQGMYDAPHQELVTGILD